MKFNYYNPVKIHFGVDWLNAIKNLTEKRERFLLVTSQGFSKRGLTTKIQDTLGKQLVGIVDNILPNPQFKYLQDIQSKLDDFSAIIALGGGSVIDSAKFLSVNSVDTSFGNFKNYPSLTKEAYSHKDNTQKRLHTKDIYAFPTTSGTSSELTHWATIWDNEAFIKHSLSDEILYPKEAFYDPILTLSLPREITIYTALDALSHSFESIWNNNTNPISTHYALRSIKIILRDLPYLAKNLQSIELRTSIMQASMYAGLAFSNTQTALAHAISYPLTIRFGIPHGLACSFSLPLLLECLPKEANAYVLLSPFRVKLLEVFEALSISSNLKDYGLDFTFINEIFANLNARAKNGIFDIECVKQVFLKLI